jgi:hypothetical protein
VAEAAATVGVGGALVAVVAAVAGAADALRGALGAAAATASAAVAGAADVGGALRAAAAAAAAAFRAIYAVGAAADGLDFCWRLHRVRTLAMLIKRKALASLICFVFSVACGELFLSGCQINNARFHAWRISFSPLQSCTLSRKNIRADSTFIVGLACCHAPLYLCPVSISQIRYF